MNMVQEHVSEMFEDQSEELIQFEKEMEIWEASDKREIQERLTTPQVVEATAQIIEHTPEAELSMKVGSTSVKGLLADFGDTIHLGKINGKYVLLLEADFCYGFVINVRSLFLVYYFLSSSATVSTWLG